MVQASLTKAIQNDWISKLDIKTLLYVVSINFRVDTKGHERATQELASVVKSLTPSS